MRGTVAWCAVVLMVLVAATAAHAQTVDTAMRGNTVVAQPALSTAWWYNPAALATMSAYEEDAMALAGWRHAASADLELSGETDLLALNWGGSRENKSFGLGAGYIDLAYSDTFGAGFGKSWKNDLSWGVSWRNIDSDVSSDSNNIFDVGLLKDSGPSGLKYGLVVRDVTDEFQMMVDIGAAMDLPGGILLAADIVDLLDEVETVFRIGATKRFGTAQNWEAGIGLDDGDLTVGAMYDAASGWGGGSWRLGAAWLSADDGDDTLILGAFGTWGM